MAIDLNRLRRGEWIAAIGAVALFVLMFFDWYDVSAGSGRLVGVGGSVDAWEAFSVLDLYLLLTVMVAVGLAVAQATQRTPALPLATAVIATVLAALAFLLILLRLLDTPGLGLPAGIDVTPTLWAWLSLPLTGVIAYGGFLSIRDEAVPTPAGAPAVRVQPAPPPGERPAPPAPPVAP